MTSRSLGDRLRSALFAVIGLLNLLPIVGVRSAQQMEDMYGVTIAGEDLGLLMRHRAILLGLFGIFLLAAAARPHLRFSAGILGLASMASFVALGLFSSELGTPVYRVWLADVVGVVLLTAALLWEWRTRQQRTWA